jgi:hypothetical protein
MRKLDIAVAAGEYTVLRLPADAEVPAGLAASAGLVSVTRTPREVSVVCPSEVAPGVERSESGWRLLSVGGPLEFMLTGVIANLAGALAAAGVALFSLSTFDTDHLLVKADDLDRAVAALREAGHEIRTPSDSAPSPSRARPTDAQ